LEKEKKIVEKALEPTQKRVKELLAALEKAKKDAKDAKKETADVRVATESEAH